MNREWDPYMKGNKTLQLPLSHCGPFFFVQRPLSLNLTLRPEFLPPSQPQPQSPSTSAVNLLSFDMRVMRIIRFSRRRKKWAAMRPGNITRGASRVRFLEKIDHCQLNVLYMRLAFLVRHILCNSLKHASNYTCFLGQLRLYKNIYYILYLIIKILNSYNCPRLRLSQHKEDICLCHSGDSNPLQSAEWSLILDHRPFPLPPKAHHRHHGRCHHQRAVIIVVFMVLYFFNLEQTVELIWMLLAGPETTWPVCVEWNAHFRLGFSVIGSLLFRF